MLAPQEDPLRYPDFFEKLQYPLICSPKIDGIRGVVKNKTMLSRTGKIIPSYQVQDECTSIEHLDGELIIGGPTDINVYNTTQSHVMSFQKPGKLSYHVFDYTHPDWLDKPFYLRLEELERVTKMWVPCIYLVPQYEVAENKDELIDIELEYIEAGYEGIMMRNPVAPYKNGRATFRQNIIYKLKRFIDDEAEIVGFEEGLTNENVLESSELGYAKRSTKKEHMVKAGTLGKFIVHYQGQEIAVAPGQLNHARRQEIWDNQDYYINKLLKFRFFAYGVKDKPRQPRAIDIRDDIDL